MLYDTQLLAHVDADIRQSPDLRLLAIFPLTGRDDAGVSLTKEVLYAYAYEPRGGKSRYFVGKATSGAPAGWPRSEFRTARQALAACAFANGFGGPTPKPINVD